MPGNLPVSDRLPAGFVKLKGTDRCPQCGAKITVWPCMECAPRDDKERERRTKRLLARIFGDAA